MHLHRKRHRNGLLCVRKTSPAVAGTRRLPDARGAPGSGDASAHALRFDGETVRSAMLLQGGCVDDHLGEGVIRMLRAFNLPGDVRLPRRRLRAVWMEG
jgi:hypothetical protein